MTGLADILTPWVIGGTLALVFAALAYVTFPRRRSFLRLLPGLFLILIPVVLLVGAAGSVIAQQEGMDLRIRQAAIAALVVASGWVVSFLLQEYRRADERDERIRDMHRAIYSDVASFLEALESPGALHAGLMVHLDRLTEDPAYVPVLSPPRRSQMFQALSGQIHVLPRVTIDLIVLFYSQVENTAEFVANMNADRFVALPADRRAVAYADYFAMLQFAYQLGEATQQVIDVYDKKGRRAAERQAANPTVSPIPNSPDAVRSDR